ncbi:MAG TPA: transposase [Ktedonobacteraceae bacterium]|nr:transposase [Ktedonobacteraceae bacterium]
MIPTSTRFDQSTLATLLEVDPVVADYRAFFSLLDWSLVERWEAGRSSRGRPAHPESAYLKAFLIRIREGFCYTTQLRSFLVKHPLLVLELGFHLVLDPKHPYGFDVERTLPTRFWLGEKLRSLDRGLLTDLLAGTVQALQEQIPGLGEVISFDVKHLYAWVKENNERVYVPERYDKTQRVAGDPDCRLGVKRSSNKELDDGSATEKKELIWGYGSGVAAATTADYGDVVLAELTQPFNEGDVTYFRPLYQQAVVALQKYPTHLAADAAYDAWYVYDAAVRHGGIAAVPLNAHSKTIFDPDGVPRCPIGLRMHPTFRYAHTYGYTAQRSRCPLLFPDATGQICEHEQFQKGKGCQKDINDEPGGRARVLMDRTSPLYHAVYAQRTACERINSQAKELGIEHPKVRNARSVANLNTLIYLVVNVRALTRAKSINAGLLSTPKGFQ